MFIPLDIQVISGEEEEKIVKVEKFDEKGNKILEQTILCGFIPKYLTLNPRETIKVSTTNGEFVGEFTCPSGL